jgi:23S rRNA (uracil1939-C5)-methyltransferase
LRVIEGYSGFGVLGRILARGGAAVVGVEADEAAARVAEETEAPGYRVVLGRVENELASQLPADLVLLNPPRSGLHPEIPRLLGTGEVGTVIYVSCDPATLARDLKRFGEGYRIREVRAFDLFPQTAHIEAVVTLEATGS